MADAYFLGIDCGTTVVKSVLFNMQGDEVSSSSQNVSVKHPKPGWADQSMYEVWDAAKNTIREAIHKSGVQAADIKGVSLSGQGGGIWLIGKDGRPVRDAVTWLDARTMYLIEKWKEDGTYEKLFDASGWLYWPGLGHCTIFPWFMENERESLDAAQASGYCKDWVKFCLTGEATTDETDALAITDPRTRSYSDTVIDLVGIREYAHLLPRIVPSYEVAGYVTAKAAEETGLAKGTPVASGAWDVSSTALGVGCVKAGDAASILGTAGIHLAVADYPAVNKAYSLSQHCVPGTWLINSMAMLAASCLNWFEREFCQAEVEEAKRLGISKYDVINREVAETPVGSHGVIFLPFLQGERAPFVRPDARGEFFGLGDWTTRKDLLRAVYEGVALATLDNYKCIEQGTALGEVWLAGGGAQSEVWAQIVADCTGKVMKVPLGTEFGARGAAINAAVAAGYFKNQAEAVEAMVRVNRVHEPNPKNTEKYAELYAIYSGLIKALWDLWRDMYQFVEKYPSP